MESMEERVSGFTVSGSWADVVELGERVTEALADAGVAGEAFDEWDEWRPKAHERLDEEMRAKTADQASVDAGAGERSNVTAGEDLQTAGEKLQDASDHLRAERSQDAIESIQDSFEHAKRAADTTGRQALRSVEDTVYRNVITTVGPQYFDNDLISANIRRAGPFEHGDGFVFEINVNDDDLKAEVSDRLAAYEADIDRWRIDADTDTSTIRSAENVDAAG